jgi:alkane 1-monooxygenase
MKNSRAFGYSLSLIPVALTVAGNVLGGAWSLLNVVFTLAGLVLLDWVIEFFSRSDAEPPLPHTPFLFDTLIFLHVIGHTAAILTLLLSIKNGTLSGGWLWFAALSTGVNSGISGITVAHELIHRKEKFWQTLGIWNLVQVCYSHFYVEHIKAHHKYAATEKDAATSRYGESVYQFIARTIPEQLRSAWHLEAERLTKKSMSSLSHHNAVFVGVVLQVGLIAAIGFGFGVMPMLGFLVQSAIAIVLLEITNYAQHYGLSRADGERITEKHSWETSSPASRFFLLELPLHSDHHFYASRAYHELLAYPNSPKFPVGYLGLLPMILIPAWWFRVMHSRIEELHASATQRFQN